jgi:hypothetical protein
MATPTSRTELKDYCLRKLGFPVIDINVDEDQLEDRIDDALDKFREHHYDGTEQIYLAIKADGTISANNYYDLPNNIIGVTSVLPITGQSISSNASSGFNIFDINYQIRLNDFYNLTSSSYTYYYIARQHLEMLNQIVVGEIPFTYNKRVNRIMFHSNISGKTTTDDYIVLDAVRIVDPTTYTKIFSDSWLKAYTTALFKYQWGSNITKYSNYTLPGGLVVNGDKIYSDAVQEIALLEEKLRDVYEAPSQFLVG